MRIPVISRIWPYISAFSRTLLAAADQAAAQSILGVSGGGGGGSTQLPAGTYTAGAIATGKFTTNDAAIASTTQVVLSQSVLGDGNNIPSVPGNTLLILVDAAGLISSFAVSGTVATGGGDWQIGCIFIASQGTNWSGKYTASFIPTKQSKTDVGLGSVPDTDATNASNLSSGTVPDARFPTTLPASDGSALVNLTAANILAGTLSSSMAAATQTANDNSTKLSTTAYVDTGLNSKGITADTGWTANADGGDKTSVIPANATLDAMQAALNLVVAGFGDAFVAVADKIKALETALANQLRPNA